MWNRIPEQVKSASLQTHSLYQGDSAGACWTLPKPWAPKIRQQKTARRPFSIKTTQESLLAVAFQFVDVRAVASRQQAGVGVDAQFGAGVADVEVAHGQLADAV